MNCNDGQVVKQIGIGSMNNNDIFFFKTRRKKKNQNTRVEKNLFIFKYLEIFNQQIIDIYIF